MGIVSFRILSTLLLIVMTVVLGCGASNPVGDGDDSGVEPPPLNKGTTLTLEGSICMSSPSCRLVQSKVIVLVDQHHLAQFDHERQVSRMLREFVSRNQRCNVSYAFFVIGSEPTRIAPEIGRTFGNNIGELEQAIESIAIPRGCDDSTGCNDLGTAMDAAEALILEDLEATPTSVVASTEYSILLFLSGQPEPYPERQLCSDVSGNSVICDPATMDCQRDLRAAVCCAPGDERPCVSSDAGVLPFCCTPDSCPAECDASIEEPIASIFEDDVREIMTMVESRGAHGFGMRTIHVIPPGIDEEQAAINDRVSSILESMADTASGSFWSVSVDELQRIQEEIEVGHWVEPAMTNLLAYNLNLSFDAEGRGRVDSDADGLTDLEEAAFGTDPLEKDSDGDGYRDLTELLLDLDPLDGSDAVCEDSDISYDSDRDGIGICEERLLGSHHQSVDSDGDLIPDGVELWLGMDYLSHDRDDDHDGDGISNGVEAGLHTDPRVSSDDANVYQYQVMGQRIESEISVSSSLTSGVEILDASTDSTAGIGRLCYEPSATGRGGDLCWIDAGSRDAERLEMSCHNCTSGSEILVRADSDGEYLLTSLGVTGVERESWWLRVHVSVEELPDTSRGEQILINRNEDVCYDFEVRDVQLAETQASSAHSEPGWNHIALYASFGEEDTVDRAGQFQVAIVEARYPSDEEDQAQVILVSPEAFESLDLQYP